LSKLIIIFIEYIMGLTGGKRKVNKSLKAWVAFVKKVQREEKLSYKDAIHRAKVRKDKGEKWMKGGADTIEEEEIDIEETMPMEGGEPMEEEELDETIEMEGGRRRRRSRRHRRSGRRRTMRRRRSSRRR
jgi:hypothetical protein